MWLARLTMVLVAPVSQRSELKLFGDFGLFLGLVTVKAVFRSLRQI